MSSPSRFNMTNLRLDLAEMTGERNALLAALRDAYGALTAIRRATETDGPDGIYGLARDTEDKVRAAMEKVRP